MLYVGTAGWSYPEGKGTWEGVFYPPEKKTDRLEFYARYFNAVEVNSTFYRPPFPNVTRSWARRTPQDFRFTAKLWQKFTHPKLFEETTGQAPALAERDFETFCAGIEPLAEAGKLGALLAQFPPSFKCEPGNLEYLEDLIRRFRDYPLAVELRHRSWTEHPDARRLFDEYGVAWTMIDEPKFRTSIGEVPLTSKLGYFRFHGRNAEQWWRHEAAEDRYNYLYSPAEQRQLADEVKAVAERAEQTYVFYNNHYRAKAVVNALELKAQLGLPVSTPPPESLVREYPELERFRAPAGGAPAEERR